MASRKIPWCKYPILRFRVSSLCLIVLLTIISSERVSSVQNPKDINNVGSRRSLDSHLSSDDDDVHIHEEGKRKYSHYVCVYYF